LNFRKGSTQVELDDFFGELNTDRKRTQTVTKSAFFQARKYLSHVAFIDLNRVIVNGFYSQLRTHKKWNGYRLCAVDGSTVRLPRESDIVNEFGVHTGAANQRERPMAMVSAYYDVLNRVVIDASLNPAGTSERDCAANHLEHAQTDDLVLYDRGYVAFWLYALHRERCIAFCMRAKTHQDLAVQRFIKSGVKQAVVTMRPNKPSIATCIERGLSTEPIQLRFVRVDLPNEVEVLITNLTEKSRFSAEQFKDLYHQRWGCEENFKRLKQWIEIANFSGKTALSVKQDYHAKIIAVNLTAFMRLAPTNLTSLNSRGGHGCIS